tara:strand:- start:137 stop:2365 length:2229 start_codon:yes stop_codon:yes gene_type:complete
MAVKFSQFNVETDVANVGYLVGYDGTDNVQITPANLIASSSIIDGSGTAAKIPKWVDSETLTDSIMTEGTGVITLAGEIEITGSGTNTIVTSSTAKLLIESTGANGNDVYLGLKSSDTEWLLKTNRGDEIGGNQGDFFIRENTAGVNVLILETNTGNATLAGTLSSGDITIAVDDTPTINFKKASSADVLGLINVTTDAGTGGKMVFQTKRNGDTALDAVVIDDAQNVGIGTGTPNIYGLTDATNLLSVQATGTNKGGIIDIAGTGTGYSGINLGNETIRRGGIYTLDGSTLALYTNASNSGTTLTERMNIASNGAATFTSDTAIGVTFKTTDVSYGAMNVYKDSTGTTRGAVGYNANSFYLGGEGSTNTILQAGGATSVFISKDSPYNVGIGTTSPDGALHVARTSYPETTELLAHFQAGVNGATSYLANRYVLIENTFTGAAYPSPALVFKNVGDAATNNVFYSSISNDAAGGISFQTAGLQASVAVGTTIGTTEKMNLTNLGNLGLGQTSGAYKLRILSDATLDNGAYISAGTSSSNHALYVENLAGSTPLLTVRGDSKVGMGTAAATYSLQVYGNLATFGTVLQNVSSTGHGLLVDSTDGTNSYVAGGFRTNAGVYKCVIYGNGDLANVNGSYGVYSDIKLKENIEDATPKLEDVCKLKVRNFDLKETKENQIGFVAQELEEVFPSLVYETDDTQDKEDGSIEKTGKKTKAIKSSVLVPILVKAIQELEARVKELENK